MSFEDDAFSKLKHESEPCVQNISTTAKCEYTYKRNANIGQVCGESLKQEGRGGMIDDQYYCHDHMKKVINELSEQNKSFGHAIFLIEKDSKYDKQMQEDKDEELQKICPYTFTKNGKLHAKGVECGQPVAKNPHIQGGEDFCSRHQPITGELNKKCEFTYFREGEEKHCHNNVKHESDRFCEECADRQAMIAEREQQELEVRQQKNQRRKCPRILTRGKRQGKPCNSILPLGYPPDQIFCKKCSNTKQVVQKQDETTTDDEDNTDEELFFQIEDDHRPPLTELPTLVGSTDRSKSIVARLPVSLQWKFILEMLIVKNIQPGPLALVLHWFANGHFKHNGKSLFELNEKWTKIPSKNEPARIQRLFEDLTTFLVERVLQPLKEEYASELASLLDSIQIKLANHVTKKVSKQSIDRFFELLMTLEKKDKLSNKKSILPDPHEPNWNEFFRCHVKIISDAKSAISTTVILTHFNQWLTERGKPNYPSGVVHFGRLLSHVNNMQWITSSAGKHLLQIV